MEKRVKQMAKLRKESSDLVGPMTLSGTRFVLKVFLYFWLSVYYSLKSDISESVIPTGAAEFYQLL